MRKDPSVCVQSQIINLGPDLNLNLNKTSENVSRNCSLAFTVAEEELGIPQLLDIDYVVRTESPDQFFIMT